MASLRTYETEKADHLAEAKHCAGRALQRSGEGIHGQSLLLRHTSLGNPRNLDAWKSIDWGANMHNLRKQYERKKAEPLPEQNQRKTQFTSKKWDEVSGRDVLPGGIFIPPPQTGGAMQKRRHK